jgi:hypothetical protein
MEVQLLPSEAFAGTPQVTQPLPTAKQQTALVRNIYFELNRAYGANTTYYVRAYATNSQGTSYGEQIVVYNTRNEGEEWQRDTQTAVVDVYNPATGKTWMDRNLGASRAATSSADANAYGDLYQWGRAADYHQKRNSLLLQTLSNSDTPGGGNFILSNSSALTTGAARKTQTYGKGVNGINNPAQAVTACPP